MTANKNAPRRERHIGLGLSKHLESEVELQIKEIVIMLC